MKLTPWFPPTEVPARRAACARADPRRANRAACAVAQAVDGKADAGQALAGLISERKK